MIYSTATVPGESGRRDTANPRAGVEGPGSESPRRPAVSLRPTSVPVVRSWRRARRTSYVNPPAASLYVERNKIAIKYILISI